MPLQPLLGDEEATSRIATEALEARAVSSGLAAWGFLNGQSLAALRARLSPETARKFGVDRARSALCAALAYDEGPPEPPAWAGAPPLGRLGRFVRRDWYGELVRRLRDIGRAARSSLESEGIDPGPGNAWRYLSNSGLPERALALEAGLGLIGKNRLLHVPGAGPGVVLGLLLLPFDPGRSPLVQASSRRAPSEAVGEYCGTCEACIRACPGGALRNDGGFCRELCIQHWATRDDPPDSVKAVWGDILYGCDLCLEACPRFRPIPSGPAIGGEIGPGLSLKALDRPDGELGTLLKGSALGLSWIRPRLLRRNAELASAWLSRLV